MLYNFKRFCYQMLPKKDPLEVAGGGPRREESPDHPMQVSYERKGVKGAWN